MEKICRAVQAKMRRMPPPAAVEKMPSPAQRMTRPPRLAATRARPARVKQWPAALRTARMTLTVAARASNAGSTTIAIIPPPATNSLTHESPSLTGLGLFLSSNLFSCNWWSRTASRRLATHGFPSPAYRATPRAYRPSVPVAVALVPAPPRDSDALPRTWDHA